MKKMKRVKIETEEEILYRDKLIAVQPDEMTDEEFGRIYSAALKDTYKIGGGAKDLAYHLKLYGIPVEHEIYNFPSSPESSSFVVTNVENIGMK